MFTPAAIQSAPTTRLRRVEEIIDEAVDRPVSRVVLQGEPDPVPSALADADVLEAGLREELLEFFLAVRSGIIDEAFELETEVFLIPDGRLQRTAVVDGPEQDFLVDHRSATRALVLAVTNVEQSEAEVGVLQGIRQMQHDASGRSGA